MKKLLCSFSLILLCAVSFRAGAMQTKAFDVNNAGATGWTVGFVDAAAKTKAVDDICESFDYATVTKDDPTPPTKNQFAMRQVRHLIAQAIRDGRRKARDKNIQPVDETDIP